MKGLMWYGWCSYFTYDWKKLKSFGACPAPGAGGIPCCPVCGCGGFQAEIAEWEKGAKEMDAMEPGYLSFLEANKENCFGKGITMMHAWKKYQTEQLNN